MHNAGALPRKKGIVHAVTVLCNGLIVAAAVCDNLGPGRLPAASSAGAGAAQPPKAGGAAAVNTSSRVQHSMVNDPVPFS